MISTLNERSQTHNCCEDSIMVRETTGFIWGGVFDGCSTGIKSHWASQMFAYVFEKYGNPTHSANLLSIRKDLSEIMTLGGLTFRNMLTTCVLFMYDKKNRRLDVRVFGDGYYYVNDVEYEVEQQNQPDYMGYHLETQARFEEFISLYPTMTFYDVNQFKICSDGIKSIGISQFHKTDIDPMALLFKPPIAPHSLKLAWNILHKNHYTISDDLSIISYVQD